MKKITADNRREICDKERECLTRKQELLRGGCWQRVGGPGWPRICQWTSSLGSSPPKTNHRGEAGGKPPLKSGVRQRCQSPSSTLSEVIPDVEGKPGGDVDGWELSELGAWGGRGRRQHSAPLTAVPY